MGVKSWREHDIQNLDHMSHNVPFTTRSFLA